ncbi:MAG: helix-turn-helix transcriptional regulator [Clostridia bacterium]|nr:helix-turn-helix transcriptional regulator [Clostridia bacterium]
MPFVFSTAVDGTNFHIRVSPNFVHRQILPNERPHKHFFIEFHYIYSGEETLILPKENREFRLTPGTITMIPCETYHYVKTKEETGVERFCFNFSIDANSETDNPPLQIFREAKEVLVFKEEAVTEQMNRCRALLEDVTDPLRETREGFLLLETAMEIFRRIAGKMNLAPKPSKTKMRQKWLIEEHIWHRYHTGGGLEELAERLYLSQRQTRKLIRQFYGEDFKTLIVRQRMEIAEILIREQEDSLEVIAEKVGYRSYSGFHLAFVRSFGCTPGEYRLRVLGQDSP